MTTHLMTSLPTAAGRIATRSVPASTSAAARISRRAEPRDRRGHSQERYSGSMPELPEVETVANGVHERVHGQRIESVWTSGKPQTFKSPEAEIAEVLTGARIERVRRVGKTIVMSLRRGEGGKADSSASLRMTKKLRSGVTNKVCWGMTKKVRSGMTNRLRFGMTNKLWSF